MDLTTARGVANLATDATLGIARVVEAVHASVLRSTGLPLADERATRGLTGFVYRSVRGTTRAVGAGVGLAFSLLGRTLGPRAGTEGPAQVALTAVLNGVLGDHLVATRNPLALPMTLRHGGRALDAANPPPANPRVLLMVHGLCMSDGHWRTGNDGRVVDHGSDTATALGHALVHVRYNTGLHVSENGRALSQQLESLCRGWPVAVAEIAVIAHSMGGLVMRSACDHATRDGSSWLGRLRHIVFLGTPHGGAPLERAGNQLDALLGATRWSAPFAQLGQVRSAGIIDLRHGSVHDDDWRGRDRFRDERTRTRHLPLPAGVACHAVAATMAERSDSLSARLLGDGLVPLASALGRDRDSSRSLAFTRSSQFIAHGTGHLALLASERVGARIRAWLGSVR